jgi:crossover junction endodeoxyribonuclease RusA
MSDPYMLLLPPLELITANGRYHWAAKARLVRAIRQATAWQAKAARIPRLERAHIIAEYLPPDRRRRDPANWAPSAKAAVDGLVDAGVLEDDDHTRVTGPDMRLGDLAPLTANRRMPRLRLLITEVP